MISLNGIPVPITIFPDKTSQVWKIPQSAFKPQNQIIWNFESEAELIHLAQLQTLLEKRGYKSTLYMPSLPYSRQDKAIDNEQTFALFPFLQILKALNFERISAFDPHNAHAVASVLSNFEAVSPAQAIQFAIAALRPDVVCYPDHGALERYSKTLVHSSIYATKVRDQSSGNISSVTLSGSSANKVVLIIDDICDGGMTFIKLAEALEGARAIHLYVSHGIFSKGTQVLRQAGIQRIFLKDGEMK